MASQDANAVAITGGSVNNVTMISLEEDYAQI
jgi:hypothetical protein